MRLSVNGSEQVVKIRTWCEVCNGVRVVYNNQCEVCRSVVKRYDLSKIPVDEVYAQRDRFLNQKYSSIKITSGIAILEDDFGLCDSIHEALKQERNSKCKCGSGKKFKKCCDKNLSEVYRVIAVMKTPVEFCCPIEGLAFGEYDKCPSHCGSHAECLSINIKGK